MESSRHRISSPFSREPGEQEEFQGLCGCFLHVFPKILCQKRPISSHERVFPPTEAHWHTLAHVETGIWEEHKCSGQGKLDFFLQNFRGHSARFNEPMLEGVAPRIISGEGETYAIWLLCVFWSDLYPVP